MTILQQSGLDRRLLGEIGERTAEDYLQQKGYRIRDRNYRCRFGEIDLVVERLEYLVFIEVKTRLERTVPVSPLISMTYRKKTHLRKAGEFYRNQKRLWDRQPRFDVIGITFQSNKEYTLEHIENAF